ncbi:trafficking protein particle complex subunit 12 [Anaeramoeba ignava]|uniref:Trafficking protein particle complex subunit 12 n=1 Tax=Anaeramoeba ignava TaxID=1746090 RepID=A0A9Q0LKG8_ANAIG|nr:trafficking protein particle complex subunit 12 [Anaeramoeba ignava]
MQQEQRKITTESALSIFFESQKPPEKLSVKKREDVPNSIDGIEILARDKNWKDMVHLTLLLSYDDLRQDLQVKLCQLIGLRQLRLIEQAAETLKKIGDLNSATFRYENYPQKYPNKKGSFVPFSLRIFAAEFPHFQNNTQSAIHNLYQIHSLCIREIVTTKTQIVKLGGILPEGRNEPETKYLNTEFSPQKDVIQKFSEIDIEETFHDIPDTLESFENSKQAIDYLSVLEKREQRVLFIIINYHIIQQNYELAIRHLHDIYLKWPKDPMLLSTLGRVFLKSGDSNSARLIFKEVEKLTSYGSLYSKMNSGFLEISNGKFSKAKDFFQEICERDPDNAVAINNLALMFLYTAKLEKAITILEDFIRKNPNQNVHEPIIYNLCRLYDLAYENPEEKREILKLVVDHYINYFNFPKKK